MAIHLCDSNIDIVEYAFYSTVFMIGFRVLLATFGIKV